MLLYVAGPYKAPTREGTDHNIIEARTVAVKLWEAGHFVICPHLNTAHFHDDCNADEDVYLEGYLEILSRCEGLILIPGWQMSSGAVAEMEMADELDMPVWFWPDYPGKE